CLLQQKALKISDPSGVPLIAAPAVSPAAVPSPGRLTQAGAAKQAAATSSQGGGSKPSKKMKLVLAAEKEPRKVRFLTSISQYIFSLLLASYDDLDSILVSSAKNAGPAP